MGVHDANKTKLKFAPQDSHTILSTSTFTQPLRAQDNELAT